MYFHVHVHTRENRKSPFLKPSQCGMNPLVSILAALRQKTAEMNPRCTYTLRVNLLGLIIVLMQWNAKYACTQWPLHYERKYRIVVFIMTSGEDENFWLILWVLLAIMRVQVPRVYFWKLWTLSSWFGLRSRLLQCIHTHKVASETRADTRKPESVENHTLDLLKQPSCLVGIWKSAWV